MPTFTAIAFDRLLEPGSRIPASKPPPPPVKLGRPTSDKKRFPLPQVSPALYATPATTPLPNSPSSFPPTPYIINHKRRGPRLLNTLSQPPRLDAAKPEPEAAAGVGVFDGVHEKLGVLNTLSQVPRLDAAKPEPEAAAGVGVFDGVHDEKLGVGVDDSGDDVVRAEESVELIGGANGEDLFDLQEELSTVSNVPERLLMPSTPLGEFFDALEEISGEGATQSSQDIDDEMCEMRLNVSMEITRRKHAEEALENLQNRWKELSHQLSLVGFSLPAPRIVIEETNGHSNVDPAEELCKQIVIARYVATSIEKGCSRAEVELEMEPQIESKNFEIARLSDRLQYYEAANREMSQRNQEAVEMARQHRFTQKRRRKWFCVAIGITLSIGTAALAWCYLSHPEPPSSHEVDTAGTSGNELEL